MNQLNPCLVFIVFNLLKVKSHMPLFSAKLSQQSGHCQKVKPAQYSLEIQCKSLVCLRYNIENGIALSIPVTTLLGVPMAWCHAQKCLWTVEIFQTATFLLGCWLDFGTTVPYLFRLRWIYRDWMAGLELIMISCLLFWRHLRCQQNPNYQTRSQGSFCEAAKPNNCLVQEMETFDSHKAEVILLKSGDIDCRCLIFDLFFGIELLYLVCWWQVKLQRKILACLADEDWLPSFPSSIWRWGDCIRKRPVHCVRRHL